MEGNHDSSCFRCCCIVFVFCLCLRQLNDLLKNLPKATFHRQHKIILKTYEEKFFLLLLWYVLILFLQGHNLQAFSYLTFASKYRRLHPLDFQSGLVSSFLSFLLARLGFAFSLAFSPAGPLVPSHTLVFSFSISSCSLGPGNSSCWVFSLQITESVFLVSSPLSFSPLMSFSHPAPSCSFAFSKDYRCRPSRGLWGRTCCFSVIQLGVHSNSHYRWF